MIETLLTHDDNGLIEFGLDVLRPRWTTRVLIELAGGPKRTTHLLRSLTGISAKTLCERLSKLQELGLVSRTKYPGVPPRVEYALTKEGRDTLQVLKVLKDLGSHWAHAEKPLLMEEVS